MRSSHSGRAASVAGYAIGIMLMVVPLLNLLTAWPARPQAVEWRLEFFGSLVNALPPATLGLGILMYLAWALFRPRALGAFATLALLACLMLLLLLGNFALDAAEISARVPPEERARYGATIVRLLLQSGLVLSALAVLAAAGFRALRQDRRAMRSASRSPGASPRLIRRQVGVTAPE